MFIGSLKHGYENVLCVFYSAYKICLFLYFIQKIAYFCQFYCTLFHNNFKIILFQIKKKFTSDVGSNCFYLG